MQTNVLDMLEYVGEDNCQKILSTFACPLNTDVENFIHTKTIQFAKQKIAISYLVFAEQDNQRYFVGYYTLANYFFSFTLPLPTQPVLPCPPPYHDIDKCHTHRKAGLSEPQE